MSDLDLKVIKQVSPVIEINFEELKKTLSSSIEEYKALVVTEQTLPICKAKQKELAGIRTKINDERLRIKKEMSKPVDAFELECKELIKLVEETEQPLKNSIKKFDDKTRDEKRKIAEQFIQASIEQHGLTEKYAKQLTVSDNYTLLGATKKGVKEDIEQRSFLLLEQQNKEKEMLELIEDAIVTANRTIKTPLKMEDFQRFIDRGNSTKEVIAEINRMAEHTRLVENPPPKPEPIPEPVVHQAPAPEQQPVYSAPSNTTGAAVKKAEPKYFVELRVEETWEGIENLGKLLKANGFEYTKLRQGKVE
jgi:hypothetical protein